MCASTSITIVRVLGMTTAFLDCYKTTERRVIYVHIYLDSVNINSLGESFRDRVVKKSKGTSNK